MQKPSPVDRLPKRWLPPQDEAEIWDRLNADPRWRRIWRELLAPTDQPVHDDDEREEDEVG